jgi:hypothetical protein
VARAGPLGRASPERPAASGVRSKSVKAERLHCQSRPELTALVTMIVTSSPRHAPIGCQGRQPTWREAAKKSNVSNEPGRSQAKEPRSNLLGARSE